MTVEGSKRGRAIASPAAPLRLLLPVMALICAVMAVPTLAVEVPALYTVEVSLDSRDPNAQTNAYRSALTEVLVRITGTTAAAESPELAGLFPDPTSFVRQFRSTPDDTLIVTLDGPAIERILRQAGATVWGRDRPLTIVWLAIDWGLGDREIVAADDADGTTGNVRSIDRNRMLRERVQAVATRRGVPIVFPLLDAEDLRGIGFVDIWGGFDEPLLDASARYGADSILVGRIRPDDPQPPRWTWYYGEQRFGWPGEPEESIDQLADALAARDALRGDEDVELIELTISGINTVAAYGRVQQFMENLRMIDSARIQSAHPDRITYTVEVQGGAERLNAALSQSNMLERVDNAYFIDARRRRFGDQDTNSRATLEFRYRPPPERSREFDPDR